jgi:hypothetical protein
MCGDFDTTIGRNLFDKLVNGGQLYDVVSVPSTK